MKDRLVEIIKARIENKTWCVSELADYLIANGVIVPPCKVGDTIYFVGKYTGDIVTARVVTISISDDDVFLHTKGALTVICSAQLGKTAFLSKEEAEAKSERALRKDESK